MARGTTKNQKAFSTWMFELHVFPWPPLLTSPTFTFFPFPCLPFPNLSFSLLCFALLCFSFPFLSFPSLPFFSFLYLFIPTLPFPFFFHLFIFAKKGVHFTCYGEQVFKWFTSRRGILFKTLTMDPKISHLKVLCRNSSISWHVKTLN